MKGLQGAMFALGHQMEVVSIKGDRNYASIDNFPNKKEEFELYHTLQQSQVQTYRQSKITVEFNVLSKVPFSKIKVGPLMSYLTQHREWLQEKCFDLPNAVPIGFIGLRRYDLVHRDNFQKRVLKTIQAYISYTQTSTLPTEQKVTLLEILSNKQIPVFSIIKVTKIVKNPDFIKEKEESAFNRKNITVEVLEITTDIKDKQVLTMILMNISKIDPWLIGRFIPEK